MTRKLLIYSIAIILITVACLTLVFKWSELKKETFKYLLFAALKKSNNDFLVKPELKIVPEGLVISIDGKNISDFSPLARWDCFALGISNMKSQKDLNFLGTPKALKELSISDADELEDISILKHLKLETLFLQAPKITDISPISDLSLKYLFIKSNKLTNLEPIKKLSKLKQLFIIGSFSNIDFLKELPLLEVLYISSDNVADLSKIKDLKNLKSLTIRNNKLIDLSFLQDLENLTYIDIDAGDKTTLDFGSIKIPPKVKEFRYWKNGTINYRNK